MMKRKGMALVLVALTLAVVVSGCVGQAPVDDGGVAVKDIESAEEAGEAVKDVSEEISDISAALKETDDLIA